MSFTSAYSFFVLLGVLFAIDVYSYRRFLRFARNRRALRRFVAPIYGFGVLVVPVLMACAAYPPWRDLSETASRIVFTVGAVYYIPKLIAFAILAVKDIFAFITWLFGWFQKHLVHAADSALKQASPDSDRRLDLSDMKLLKRREFVQQMGMSVVSTPLVSVGYGVFRNLYDFDVRSVDIKIPNLDPSLQGLKLVQISDLHAGSLFSERPMWEAVELVNSLEPDLVAITGDFVNEDPHEVELILPPLRRLEASIGVYGCLGNHDHLGDVRIIHKSLATTSVELLTNEHRDLRFNGKRLFLVGTDNTGHGQDFGDLTAAMKGIDATDDDVLQILLAHDPRYWDTTARTEAPAIDLTLSGHTHGGQFGIERGRVRLGWARFAYPRWAGHYAELNSDADRYQQLYVNRGLGTSGAPLRVGIRPEITVLTLIEGIPELRTSRSASIAERRNFRNNRLRYIDRVRSHRIAS